MEQKRTGIKELEHLKHKVRNYEKWLQMLQLIRKMKKNMLDYSSDGDLGIDGWF